MLEEAINELTRGYSNIYTEDSSTGALVLYSSYRYKLQYNSTQYGEFKTVVEQAITDGYLEKLDVNYYVCLNEETPCSEANLFRIIGVFDGMVKLIKSSSIGKFYWGGNGTSPASWSSATLNTYLNGTYLISLGTKSNIIYFATWKTGASDYSTVTTTKSIYNNEIVSTTDAYGPAKIGLMYVSDYGYASLPSGWTNGPMYGQTNQGETAFINWLYGGIDEWTISRNNNSYIYYIDASYSPSGNVATDTSNDYADIGSGPYGVRPTFYLNSM